jgi:predicted nucleic acid-binding protein
VVIVDASVLATALGDDGPDGDTARAALAGQSLAAPELIDLELASVYRRQVAGQRLRMRRAELALTDLADLPIHRVPHRLLVARCWELRANLTIYDAAYVAVADLLSAALTTADVRLVTAPGPRCRIEVMG